MKTTTTKQIEGKTYEIDLTPTWAALVPVMVAVLRNPDADSEAVSTIEGEFMRLAELADKVNAEARKGKGK